MTNLELENAISLAMKKAKSQPKSVFSAKGVAEEVWKDVNVRKVVERLSDK